MANIKKEPSAFEILEKYSDILSDVYNAYIKFVTTFSEKISISPDDWDNHYFTILPFDIESLRDESDKYIAEYEEHMNFDKVLTSIANLKQIYEKFIFYINKPRKLTTKRLHDLFIEFKSVIDEAEKKTYDDLIDALKNKNLLKKRTIILKKFKENATLYNERIEFLYSKECHETVKINSLFLPELEEIEKLEHKFNSDNISNAKQILLKIQKDADEIKNKRRELLSGKELNLDYLNSLITFKEKVSKYIIFFNDSLEVGYKMFPSDTCSIKKDENCLRCFICPKCSYPQIELISFIKCSKCSDCEICAELFLKS